MHYYGPFAYTLHLVRVSISNVFPVVNVEFDLLSTSLDLYLFNKLSINRFRLVCIHFFRLSKRGCVCLFD
jgi:hypothetical protein